ncbi:phage tail protein [Aeromonas rivipollensis]|uniref:phage tail-collar fiber domain-containing protein n=1 Tax=Aeromonas rivipollensis TaxID=948519 RepID=UPI001F09357D|nr:phage tail protein [Aeromonas rivipollensis]
MSQVITNAFEQYWQSSLAAEQPVVLDEFILADIPNLDITYPIDPDTGLPPESQIVHRQTVDQRGRINNNAVAYTIVMDTTVGDFSFNAMYLRNKANGVIGMIVYKGRETKLKTDQTTGQTGNSLVKSMLMGYDQAAEATLTNVDAGTWQIDYAARLRGQDEDLRQLASQLYGHHTFIGDGFKVVQQDGGHQVTQGVAIVGGLRIELKQPEVIYPGTKPIGVWVDVHRAGSLLSEHQNHFTIITSVADLTDHVDSSGYQHYVAKLGTVQADNSVVDGRGQGGAGLIGGQQKMVTWTGFAGGADSTGVLASDAAFLAAGISGSTCFVPNGTYLLTSDITNGSFTLDSNVVFTGAGKLLCQAIKMTNLINDYGINKGKRWASDTPPVKIHRFRDRVFIGGSANNNGGISNQGGNTTSWLDDPSQLGLNVGNASLEQNATFACATESGLGAAVFATRTSDYGPQTGGSLALTSVALNDKVTTGYRQGSLAGYVVSVLSEKAQSDSGYSATCIESNLWNQKQDASPIDPYNFFPTDLVKNLWLSNGFPENEHSRQNYEATCAVGVLNNVIDETKGKYKVGIAFKATSLAGTDGITGRGIAMSLARGHSFQWYLPNGAQGPYINSSVDASANEIQALVFSNFGTQLLNRSNQKIHFLAGSIPVANNYPKVIPSVSGSAVRYAVEGDDADIDLQLVPKGNGVVKLGTAIVPNLDNTRDFGTAALRGRTAYFGTGTINTSDERHKPIIERITDELLDAWGCVGWSDMFKFDDAIAEKGADGARWHFGLVAQRVRDALDSKGIDGFTLGLLCHDQWDDVYEQILQNEGATTTRTREVERPVMTTKMVKRVVNGVQTVSEEETPQLQQIYVVDENGEPVFNEDGTRMFTFTPVMETVVEEYEDPDAPIYATVLVLAAGDRYGIRYEEALSLEAALQRRNHDRQQVINEELNADLQQLMNRVIALEAA